MTHMRIAPMLGALLIGAAAIGAAAPASAQEYRGNGDYRDYRDYPPAPAYPAPAYPAPSYPAYQAPQYPAEPNDQADPGYPPYPNEDAGYRADDRADGQDIIVEGRYHGHLPDDVRSASQPVNYADLDLRYSDDRAELRRRVSDTARYLCERLGENDRASILPLGSGCREQATRDAMRRVGTVEAQYVPDDSVFIPERRRGY